MADHATPNLPSRNFETSSCFYQRLGFKEAWRDDEWMILRRGNIQLEFFPHPELDPATSWFSCCIRLENLAGFYKICKDADLPETSEGWPRLHAPKKEPSGLTVGALIDPDGTLIRLIQN
ncbi:bleomycin resistance protein [Sphingopyxis terrae]|uniref:bleomycin resistance protein n=1 Tax=Sphingopyxis terrae TaxID=33052 RepID=UPI000787FE65|nr:bleomycin resistance protein [Sphingopyxis terrae]